MARIHRGGFEAWLRGGQTAGHTFDMTLEVIGKLLWPIAFWTIGVLCVLFHFASPAEQLAGFETLEAAALARVGPPLPQTLSVKSADGSSHAVAVGHVGVDPDIGPPAALFWRRSRGAVMIWLAGMLVLGFVTGCFFVLFGQDKMKARQIRGQEIDPLPALMKQITEFNRSEARRLNVPNFSAPLLAGVPYPFRTEMEHTLIVGAPGSGKSQAIHQLIESIRGSGQRAIIFDPELDYIRHHYNPATDVILNPFDARSPGWSPFFDAKDTPDWVKLSHAIFKDPKSGDPYWVNVARTLFSWTGYQLMERQRRDRVEVTLTDALDYLFGPPKALKALLEGTPAAMHLNGLEGARVSSLISVLAEGVEPLIYLHGAKGRFSIRNWVNGKPGVDGVTPSKQDEGLARPPNGFLFLSAPESHMDALRPLLGFWSELAVSALLSRHGMGRETTWFILDEFHSAGRVDALADGPQRLRKYGGAVVLGFQQISQLHDLYGPDKAKTIIGQCQTKLILRAGDFETATLMSEQLGRRVMRRVDENTSYGANSIRDGVGLIPKEELEPIMLPEDVQNFSKFEGALRVSNARPDRPFPIARIKLQYIDRPVIAEGFTPCDSDPVREYLASVQARAAKANSESPAPAAAAAPTPPRSSEDGSAQAPPKPEPGPKDPTSSPASAVDVGSPGSAATTDVQPHLSKSSPPSANTPPPIQPVEQSVSSIYFRQIRNPPATAVTVAQTPQTESVSNLPVGPLTPPMNASSAAASFQSACAFAGEGAEETGGPEKGVQLVAEADEDTVVEERLTHHELEARPEDLNNEEARRRKRREEDDALEWARRDAILRGEPLEQRVVMSVYQREIALAQALENQTEYLGIEHVTQSEVIYAAHHQHADIGEAGALLLEAIVGANLEPGQALIGASNPEGLERQSGEGEPAFGAPGGGSTGADLRAAAEPDADKEENGADPEVEDLPVTLAPTAQDLPITLNTIQHHHHHREQFERAEPDPEHELEEDFEITMER